MLSRDAQRADVTDDERAASAELLLGYRFSDRSLPVRALTHRSFLHENPDAQRHNERLEYLGDAVLGLVAAEYLWDRSPYADEGELTRRRAAWVSEPPLAKAARAKSIGELLLLGRGERRSGGKEKASLLADAVEALIGAVFVDGGIDAARDAIFRLLGEPPDDDVAQKKDVKGLLQERVQADRGQTPRYEVERFGGSEHHPRFLASVWADGEKLGEGQGPNTKEATRAAAAAALARMTGR
jgi:ribonuclease-3